MSLISFTPLNRKTVLLLFFITMGAIANIIPDYLGGIVPFDIDLMDYSCQILVSLPFLLRKIFKKKNNIKIFDNFTRLDYIIFALMIVIDLIDATIYVMFDDTLFFMSSIFNRFNIDIFLCGFLSIYTSNSEYFRHHAIGQIIILIPSTMVDIYRFLNNDEKNIHLNWKHFLVFFIDCIVENTVLTYKKYLMEIKFISPFIVCFVFAFINLAYLLILLLFKLINRYVLCFETKCFTIFDFDTDSFDNSNFKLALSLIISIICDSIFFFFYYNIFNLFTTSHTLFCFYIYVSMHRIKNAKDNDLSLGGWFLISLAFIFIFIGLFIYLEIIELNFCNLSKNTKIRIAERAKESMLHKTIHEEFDDFEELEGEENNKGQMIEFVPGYLIKV